MFWATINFKKLLQLLLQSFLRQPDTTAFLNAIVAPLDSLYADTLYNMQHTCQVIYLEKLLNEHYNITDYDPNDHQLTKKIKISDVGVPLENYIYLDAEIPPKTPIYLGTVYLTGNVDHFDFYVQIPATLVYVDSQLRAIIDYYKLAGKKYLIQTY